MSKPHRHSFVRVARYIAAFATVSLPLVFGAAGSTALAQQARDGDRQMLPPGLDGGNPNDGNRDGARSEPAPGAAGRKPADPIAAVVRAGNTTTTLGRAKLRDNLYALLATAENEEVAKRIGEEIEKLWLMPGSDTVSLLMLRSNEALKAKDSALALKFLDTALKLAPEYAEAWNRRAYVYYEAGDLRRAVGDLRRVLALDPNHFKALHGLGTIMRELDQDAAALKAYERLIEVNPYWEGAQKAYDELKSSVEGRGI